MSATGEPRHQLVVVRHAKSSWDDSSISDHDRPLAPRGRKALPRLRDHLERLSLQPGLVLCSSARRTRETLDGIRPALGGDVSIEIDPGLYGATADELLDRLRRVNDDVGCVLLVGHNPGVADLVELLAPARGAAALEVFPTAATAILSFEASWRHLEPASASVDSFWTPRRQ